MQIRCIGILALALTVAACVTTKDAQQRIDRAGEIHRSAPAAFVDIWHQYLNDADGRYGIFAIDRNLRGSGWYYCTSGCQALFGNQSRSIKSLWAHRAREQCEKSVRRQFPSVRPQCAIYAIKDEVVWPHPIPWQTSYSDPSQQREPISFTPEAAGKLSTRSVSTTWQGYDDILNGRVSFETGGPAVVPKRMVMVLDDGRLTCDGTYIPARSQWKIACSNGREASGRFIGLGQGKGAHGEGTDNLGNKVQFIMGAAQ